MQRDLEKLQQKHYDLLVIGGGIHGAFVAWDATLRGLSVALIDRGDFGGATSANSLKTVHGGLRYLQDGDLKLVRKMIRERRAYLRIAPHLVHPLPCVMPTYRPLKKNKLLLRPALVLNDLLGSDRNNGLDQVAHLPKSKPLTKDELFERLPGLDPTGVTGGVSWHDGQVYNSERFLISILQSAASVGADIANYVTAQNLLFATEDQTRVIGANVCDQLTEKEFEIKASLVVNATGAWTDQLLSQIKPKSRFKQPRFHLSTAINVVTRQFIDGIGAGIFGQYQPDPDKPNKKSRLLFISPWRTYSIIGTVHQFFDGDPAEHKVTDAMVQALLDEVNEAYPGAELTLDDVKLVHRGFLPTTADRDGDVKLVRKGQIHDHLNEDGVAGLISAVGVKYTTARDVAEQTVDMVIEKLELDYAPSTTAQTPVFGGNFLSLKSLIIDAQGRKSHRLDYKDVISLVYNYGREYETILFMMDDEDDQVDHLPLTQPHEKMIAAQVRLAIREEMAITLADVIRRRTDFGSAGHPGAELINFCAEIMAAELDWDASKIEQEIDAVDALYAFATHAAVVEPQAPLEKVL